MTPGEPCRSVYVQGSSIALRSGWQAGLPCGHLLACRALRSDREKTAIFNDE